MKRSLVLSILVVATIVVGCLVPSCKNVGNKSVIIDGVLTKDPSTAVVVSSDSNSNTSNTFDGFVCDTIYRPKGCKDNIFAYSVLYAINLKSDISTHTDSANWRKCVKLLNFKANKGIIVLKYDTT